VDHGLFPGQKIALPILSQQLLECLMACDPGFAAKPHFREQNMAVSGKVKSHMHISQLLFEQLVVAYGLQSSVCYLMYETYHAVCLGSCNQ